MNVVAATVLVELIAVIGRNYHQCLVKKATRLEEVQKPTQQIISAEAPLSEMFGYATSLRSLSSGRATYSMHFEKYVEVPSAISEKVLEEKQKEKK